MRDKAPLGLMVLAMVMCAGIAANAQLSGAIFTTLGDGTSVNHNVYTSKELVYLNGGPQNEHSAGLPDGTYYFQVTDPSGATLLSADNAVCRQILVAGGVVAGATGPCPHPNGDFNNANGSTPVKLMPFDNTPNHGGEYKVWLIAQNEFTTIDSQDPRVLNFRSRDAKTDNFKVREQVQPNEFSISGTKYYDANTNGQRDGGEPGIQGWKIELFGDATNNTTTDSDGEFAFLGLADQTTNGVCEVMPQGTPIWVNTTPTQISGIMVGPDSTGNDFGNVCLGAGGGRTLGFWSNKNGQALFGADDLAAMVALNLRNAAGNNFDPGSYAQFRNWLLSANATNMAYMLSAQLAAMDLNVLNGFVNGSSLIYAPGTSSANSFGFASVSAVITEANTELGLHGLALADSPQRAYQEALKNALDRANNNLNFVQAEPCDVNYTGDEPSCAPAVE